MNCRLNRWWLGTLWALMLSCLRALAVPVDKPLIDVTYGGGAFVAVGIDGTIYSSVTGGAWEKRSTGVTNSLHTVSFGSGVFIAAGVNGVLVRSTNGVDWTVHSVPIRIGVPDSAWGDGRFVVLGNGPDATWTELTSTNGIDWAVSHLEAAGYVQQNGTVGGVRFGGVGYGNGRFLATGGAPGLNLTLTSADGLRWKEQPNDGIGNRGPVVFSGNQFAAVAEYYNGDDDDDGGVLTAPRISEDGQIWQGIGLYSIHTVAATDCGFAIAVALGPNSTRLQFVTGRQIWPVFQYPPVVEIAQTVTAMATGGGRFFVVGSAISEVSVPADPMRLDISPPSTLANLGSSVLIYAVPVCFGTTGEIRWYRGESEIPGVRGTSLLLSAVDLGAAGEYHARMTLADGTEVRSPSSVLIVKEPPIPPDPVPAPPAIPSPGIQQAHALPEGANHSNVASVTGYPVPAVQWRRNNAAIPGATNLMLHFHRVTPDDAGIYDLVASNRLGVAVSAPIRIEVLGSPPLPDSNPPVTLTIREGAPVQIPPGLLHFGAPSGSMQIRHNGQPTELRVGTSGSLNLKQVRLADAGVYQMVVSNAYGSLIRTMATLEVVPGDALSRWTLTSPLPFNATITDIAFGAGRFVAVATDGLMASSVDGTNWTPVDLRTTANLDAVAYGNGRFVAVGGPGIVTSGDGLQWTAAASSVPWNLRAVTFGNGQFIAAGGDVILSSTDGLAWEEVRLDPYPQRNFMHAAFGDGRFVLVTSSFDSPGMVWISANGVTWEAQSLSAFPNSEAIRFVGGKFAMVGDDGLFATSADAVSWNDPVVTPGSRLLDVAYGNGRWVAVGTRGRIVSSADGANWRKEASGTEDRLEAVCFANGMFVAGGENGTTVTSIDGSHWTPPLRAPTSDLDDITIAGDKVLIAGKDGTILVTTNGLDFSRANSRTAADLHGVGWIPGLHVAVGEPGIIVTSPDAKAWTVRPVASTSSLKSVAHGAGRWVAVGTGGEIIVSGDGTTWAPVFSPTVNDLNSIAYGNGLFVIVGDNTHPNGTLLTSTDGLNWARRNQNFGKNLRSVTFLDGRFIATGNDGYRLESTDGLRWITRYPWEGGIGFMNLRAAGWGAGHLALAGNFGALFTSTNGTNWIYRTAPTLENLHGVVHFAGHFIAIGNRGTILRSDFIARTPELELIAADQTGTLGVRLQGEPGIAYQFEATEDLLSPIWIPVEAVAEPDGVFSVREAAADPRRFYRARIR